MKSLLILITVVLTVVECKPVADSSKLPHSREFYAGYIKAITDNFDQLFETDRQTRSTKEEDENKTKDDKSTEAKHKIEKRSTDTVANIDRVKEAFTRRRFKPKEKKYITVTRRTREFWYNDNNPELPFMDANVRFFRSSAVSQDNSAYDPYENYILNQRGNVLQPQVRNSAILLQPQPRYFGFNMIQSQPNLFKLFNKDLSQFTAFDNPIGHIFPQNNMILTPLTIQTAYLLPQSNRGLIAPFSGQTRDMILRRDAVNNSTVCACACPSSEPTVNQTLTPAASTTNETVTRDANPASSNNNNNCGCNNNGGGSNNNNQCCCCCQPCCCCHHCCHHCCCCQPCCHQECCCQPCCCHQQHCCCHHHVHDCCCCNHEEEDRDCCHEHHTTHCCPTYHNKKITHNCCHKCPCCCHESHHHNCHCTHIDHCHPHHHDCCHHDHHDCCHHDNCHHDCCHHDCCHHDCCHHDDCHHDCCHHHGDHGSYGSNGGGSYIVQRVPLLNLEKD